MTAAEFRMFALSMMMRTLFPPVYLPPLVSYPFYYAELNGPLSSV